MLQPINLGPGKVNVRPISALWRGPLTASSLFTLTITPAPTQINNDRPEPAIAAAGEAYKAPNPIGTESKADVSTVQEGLEEPYEDV